MPFEAAKYFLYRVLPWAPIGEPASFMNIHWTHQKEGYAKPFFNGVACQSLDECIRTVSYALRKPETRDIYFACASMRTYEVKQFAGGGSIKQALRNQENVVQIRTLWLDLDVEAGNKSGKAYPDEHSAAVAFAKFLRDSDIPGPTLIVQSGSGGMHIYWTLGEALTPDKWQPLANALAEATRRHGLLCDTGCTVDSARVLRVPETFNAKGGTRKPVVLAKWQEFDRSVDQMRRALAPYMGATVHVLTPRGNINAELSGGIERFQAPPVDLDTVAAAGCGFIGDALSTGGADYANPLWNLTTLVSVFTEGGRSDAHRMAKDHATYSVADTDSLFDRKTKEREEKNIGWPTCTAVENSGCTACATCPLKGPTTKPLQFGTPRAVATVPNVIPLPNEPDLPPGYNRNGRACVTKVVFSKDGSSRVVEVIPHPIFAPWIQEVPYTLHFRTRNHEGRERPISLLYEVIASSEALNKAMGVQGILVAPDNLKGLKEFLVAWSEKLATVKDAVVSAQPFGWNAPLGKIDGFSYAGRLFQKGGDKPAAQPSVNLKSQYDPRGELQPWLEAARMVTDARSPERDAYLAASFAAPLVRHTGLSGLMISTYSTESGIGKSTALKVAQAVWGDPVRAIHGQSDTQNAVIGKIGQLQALPLFWDELKTEQDTQRFVSMIFQLTGGKEKARMGADTQLREIGTWSTLLMSASNESLLDYAVRATKTTTASIYRIFEYVVPPVASGITTTQANQAMLKVHDNYGQAGLVYARWLGEHYDTVHRDVATLMATIEKKHMTKPDERQWLGTMTVVLMGAMYANKLGLTQIDEAALYRFLVKSLGNMRAQLRETPVDMMDVKSVTSILTQYVASQRGRNYLETDKIWGGKGRPPLNHIQPLSDLTRLQGIHIHMARDAKVLRISKTHLTEWLQDNRYSTHTVMTAFENKFGMKTVHVRLGSGTPSAGGLEYVAEFDLARTGNEDLMEV